MSDLFISFNRIIESEKIDSIFTALQILYNVTPDNELPYVIKGTNQNEIGVHDTQNLGIYTTHNEADFFLSTLSDISSQIIEQIDKELLGSENKIGMQQKLEVYHSYSTALIRRFDKKTDTIKSLLELVKVQLQRIVQALTDRTGSFAKKNSDVEVKSQPSTTIPKIKWNGGVSTLGTLFRELRNHYGTNTGKNLIDGKESDIINFIRENFVNENGEQFEFSSIQSYVYENKKTAKTNRVDLETIFSVKRHK